MSTVNFPTVEIDTAEVPMVSEKEVLEAADKIVGNKAPHQFGFRKGRSTTDALILVANTAKTTLDEGKCCAVVTLDVPSIRLDGARYLSP